MSLTKRGCARAFFTADNKLLGVEDVGVYVHESVCQFDQTNLAIIKLVYRMCSFINISPHYRACPIF